MDTTPHWHCTWRTGPDTGGTTTIGIGRHLVGSAPRARVRCDDPALEPHHLQLEVHADGRLTATQLTGRVPARRSDGTVLHGTAEVPPDSALEVGASTLWCTRVAAPSTHSNVRPDGTVLRQPRAVPCWTPAELTPPAAPTDRREPPGGLLPALLGLLGAGVMAVLMRQPMFVLFGAMGAVVALGSWGAQHVADRRRRAHAAAEHAAASAAHHAALAADRDAFVRAHLAATPNTATARISALDGTALWERRPDHADAWRVSVGLGSVAWRTDDHTTTLPDLPVAADLGTSARVAVVGHDADAVARALLLQLATSCGPADLRIVVATLQPDRWTCLRGLPHLATPDGTDAIVRHDELPMVFEQFGPHAPHVVLVTDDADAVATRTSAVRRALAHGGAALLAVLPDGHHVPSVCTAALTMQRWPVARWVRHTATTMLPEPVRAAGLSEQSTHRLVAAIAPRLDPEDTFAMARLPTSVQWHDVMGTTDANAIAARWTASGADPAPRTPIGTAADGVVDVDLQRDGPHGLLAGTTGAGKSELLRTMVAGLAAHSSPAHLQFVLVDYKGGATFDALTALPHVVGVITDLDAQLADRALRSLHAELRRREALLREWHAADLTALRTAAPHVPMARLVVVVDEFAALVAEQSEFLHALVGVAQRGRSLGVHLLLATQRPQGVISDDIRANANLRVALRLQDDADSVDVVGDRIATTLPRRVPGRGVMRLGPDEHVVFQTARVDDVGHVVQAIAHAATRVGASTGSPPWQPPLPSILGHHEVGDGEVGRIDDPDRQRQFALRWRPDDGSVAVAGSGGSGVSSTLRTLAAQALECDDTHVYVLTARVGEWATAADHPAVVVVQATEHERMARALHRLRRPALDQHRRVVVIDDLDAVRRALDSMDHTEEHDALHAVLLGVHGDVVVAGAATPSAFPTAFVGRCAHRWVLHLHDPHEAFALGVASAAVPGPVPGRVHLAELGLAAQFVVPPADMPTARATPVAPITQVPERVNAAALPAGCATDDHLLLPLGLEVASGVPWVLAVPDGDHVLVLGGSRSGRSTALSQLAAAWRQAHPAGEVVALLPRRSAFDRTCAHVVLERHQLHDQPAMSDGPVLLVVDDAELVDDPTGWLAAAVGARRPGLTVVAAARPDALRQRYGHWTLGVRHSRLGLVAAGGGDTDGDLLSAVVPRRSPVAPRPGLMWVAHDGDAHLVQVAVADGTRVRHHLAAN